MAVVAEGRLSRRLASPAIRALLRRRMSELGGVLLGLGGVALLVALLSYHAQDPSLNTASAARPANLAGPVGAILSDLLLQGFGLAAALPGLAMLTWAWRIASHRALALPLRLAALLAGLPVLAAVLAAVPLPGSLAWPTAAGLGGAIGQVVAQNGLGAGRGLLGPLGAILVWTMGLALASVLTLLALGLSLAEARRAGGAARAGVAQGRRVAGFGSRVVRWLAAPILFLARLFAPRQRHEPAYAMPSGAQPAYGADDYADPTGQGGETAAPELLQRARPDRAVPQRRDPRPNPIRGLPPMPEEPTHSEPTHSEPMFSQPGREPPRLAARSRIAPPTARPPAPRQESLPLGDAGWQFPPLSLLKPPPPRGNTGPSEEALQANARLLESVLSDYGVQGTIREIRPGPVVTLYELEPAPGIRSARVIGLADDVARSLSVTRGAHRHRVRSQRHRHRGAERQDARPSIFRKSSRSEDVQQATPAGSLLALGKDISGAPIVADLARACRI